MMRCALEVPADRPALFVDPDGPSLTTELLVTWRGLDQPYRLNSLVDTGSPYDLIASPRLTAELDRTARPVRSGTLQWRGTVNCKVYRAAVRIGDWLDVWVHAPQDEELEDLIGLPTILRSGLCIRGFAGSAHWVSEPGSGSGQEWMTADREGGPGSTDRGHLKRRRTRRVPSGR